MKALQINTDDNPSLELIKNEKSQASKDHLLHPVVDFLMIGGLSIIFFVGMHFFVNSEADSNKIGWLMFYLSFAINFPHFMSTYVLLYKDYRKEIFNNWKFSWVAFVAPLILASMILFVSSYAVANNSTHYLGCLTNLMFFLVGHHYVKQTYGCVMVSCAKRKFYFSKFESRVLWLSMYSVWMMSFISSNSYTVNTHNFYGITYSTLGLDVVWLNTAYALTAFSTTSFLALMVKRFIHDGKVLPMSAWAALLSIYIWYIPGFYHKHYFLMIPFFHSLQYLLFSGTFAKNKALEESKVHSDGPVQRAHFLKSWGGFCLLSITTGFLAWHFIPNTLDAHMKVSNVLGPTLFMFSFQIFLNIHHYLIDNVIWRSSNQQMKKYL
jgi:hypothetical protein